ncbi:MAG: VCBS repeat-containing protein [Deltaproteobacteria bacterium]|nr:VCBS repeat-containing protein [Deltaproteobacteria bacterium]
MRSGLWALMATLLAAPTGAEEPPFRLFELASPGRTAAAGFADFDGDGRTDLYSVSLSGIPPRSHRELRVYFQDPGGTFRTSPDWSGPIEPDSAAYDVAALDDEPGLEFLQLRRHSISVLSLRGRAAQRRELVIPGDPTAAVGADERGIDHLHMARDLGDGLRLLVPGLGECIVLERDGALVARLAAGQRANYFIPKRPGPLLSESEFESYFDFPRIEVGDANGDGRPDLLFASRHELRVFHQTASGGFEPLADQKFALGRLTEKDLIRGSGNVRVVASDINGNGLVDLIVTSTTGGLMSPRSETTVHLNRDGSWNLAVSDRDSVLENSWSALQIVDIDGDARPELIEARMPLSILELVETLITQEIDIEISIYRAEPKRGFAMQPTVKLDMHTEIDFETTSLRGFAPSIDVDLNGDGGRDRVTSAGGDAIEVYLGSGEKPFQVRAGHQPLDSHGSIRFGDLDGDELTDALIFSKDRPDTPIRVLVNRGVLPGTPPRAVLTSGD